MGGINQNHWHLAIRLRDWLQAHEESSHLMMACTIGILGGVINLVFNRAMDWIGNFYVGQGESQVDFVRSLSWQWAVIIPTLGGGCAGLILLWRDLSKKSKSN